MEAEIIEVRLLPQDVLQPGDTLSVEIDYQTSQPLDSAVFSIAIIREDGQVCIDVNTLDMGIDCVKLHDRGTIKLSVDRLDLCGGRYHVNVGLHKQNLSYAYDYHCQAYPLIVDAPLQWKGMLCPPMRWFEVLADGESLLKNNRQDLI